MIRVMQEVIDSLHEGHSREKVCKTYDITYEEYLMYLGVITELSSGLDIEDISNNIRNKGVLVSLSDKASPSEKIESGVMLNCCGGGEVR